MRSLTARAGALTGALFLGAIGWFGGLHASGNFHAVRPGELYRAGQLSPEALDRRIDQAGIRSVVNLRGPNTGTAWYDAEVAASRAAGVAHYDFRMSSRRILSDADAGRLIALLKHAPKPVLVHCEGGADRSGLAAALYLSAVAGASLDEAGAQLSPRFGHLGIRGITPAWPMDVSWARIRDSLRAAAAPVAAAPEPDRAAR